NQIPESADKNEPTSSKLGSYFIWDRQGDIPAALNKWMEAIPDGNKDTFGTNNKKTNKNSIISRRAIPRQT
ncbi:MAG: hypothetical protein PUH56_03260, partial [Bacteroidales bacterium]|nr:hypothetical protein [Bacteroidales bacterium]